MFSQLAQSTIRSRGQHQAQATQKYNHFARKQDRKKVVIPKNPGIQKSHTCFGMQLGTTQATAVQRQGQEINITPLSLAAPSPAVFQLLEFLPGL